LTTSDQLVDTIASASISTSIRGSIKALTSTMLVAGRMEPKTAPCARPIASQSRASPTPTISPALSVAVVPETKI
jgi:hypothetical protein